jgi:hypothetical protein
MATPPTPWEIAKEILVQDIGSGRIPRTMGPKEVHNRCQEYRDVDYKKFRTNLNNLRKALYKLHGKATVNNAAFANDLRLQRLRPPPAATTAPRWDGSVAQRLLKIDVDAGNHIPCTPCQLWNTHPNAEHYKVFALEVFRKHIHQEVRSRTESSYWLHRGAKKKKKTAADYVIVDHI